MWLFPWLSYAAIVLMGGVLVVLASMPEQRPILALSTVTVMVVFGALRLHQIRKRHLRRFVAL
jgi:L-asparagine transporter-like permease